MHTVLHAPIVFSPSHPPLPVSPPTPQVVYDRRKIFWRYAKGWFIIDVCAAFPFTFLPGLGPDAPNGNHEVAYLFTVPKVFRLYGLLSMAQENYRLNEGVFLGVRTLLSVIVVSSACAAVQCTPSIGVCVPERRAVLRAC